LTQIALSSQPVPVTAFLPLMVTSTLLLPRVRSPGVIDSLPSRSSGPSPSQTSLALTARRSPQEEFSK
jgi:hypothetical protein